MKVVVRKIGIFSPLGTRSTKFFDNIFNGFQEWTWVDRFSEAWGIPKFKACAFNKTFSLEEMVNASVDDALENQSRDGISTLICFASSSGLHDNILDRKIKRQDQYKKTSLLYLMSHIIKKYFSDYKFMCFNTACASGGDAISYAFRRLKRGTYKRAIVIGADALSPLTVSGFMSLGAVSAEGCRPFSNKRDGMSFGEGAACLVLEACSKSTGDVEICGIGQYNDHYHITAPNPSGEAISNAMKAAIGMANLDRSNIDYINAHGTGTKLNDDMEANAFNSVFGNNCPYVSSSKSQIGHTLGAAGIFEAAITIEAIKIGVLPPTIINNSEIMNKHVSLVTNTRIHKQINYALSNSIGFGGNAVSIAFKGEKL